MVEVKLVCPATKISATALQAFVKSTYAKEFDRIGRVAVPVQSSKAKFLWKSGISHPNIPKQPSN